MIIDSICAILLVLAAFKGYRKGLIVGIFSYLTFIIGLAAAMKLSAVVAVKIGHIVKVSDRWLPFLAFVFIFFIVALLVRWIARLVQKAFEKIMLGWLNRLGGVLLFAILYLSVFLIFLFYLEKMHLFAEDAVNGSVTYPYIKQLGMVAIEWIGKIVPVFKDLFSQLEHFFENVANKAA